MKRKPSENELDARHRFGEPSGLSQVPAQCDCPAHTRTKDAFVAWWEVRTAGSKHWAPLGRLAAKDAWEAALQWSGYYPSKAANKYPVPNRRHTS